MNLNKLKELKNSVLNLSSTVDLKSIVEGEDISDDDLKLINGYSRRELKKDELYTYPIILCDNEIDRDNEYFLKEDLEILSRLFVGKTGIHDHRWSSGRQHSRVFKTEIVKLDKPDYKNYLEPSGYYALKAWAYTIKRGNEDLIANVDAGILKEVSVGFKTKDKLCSICGNSFYDYENCKHWPGREYTNNGITSKCYLRMKEPTDAFEYSFVAVPAQPAAGVVKGVKLEKNTEEEKLYNLKQGESSEKQPSIFYAQISKRGEKSMKHLKELIEKAKSENAIEISIPVDDLKKDLSIYEEAIEKNKDLEGQVKELEPKATMGEQYIEDLKKECTRLGKMAEGEAFNVEMMGGLFEKCSVDELKTFKSQYEKKVDEKYPPQPQTKNFNQEKETKITKTDNSKYQG